MSVAIIPARGGSKGIPRKNLIKVAGKPLLVWSIEHALNTQLLDSVWVTSDDEEILKVAESYGARGILRPNAIAGDQASSESAWAHAIDVIEGITSKTVDVVVGMQATSPVRGANDLQCALEKFHREQPDSLLSVTRVEDYFEWKERPDGFVESINYDYRKRSRRQDIEPKFLENGSFYIFHANDLKDYGNRLSGNIGFYEMEKHTMYQIDEFADIKLCEAILRGYSYLDVK